MTNQQQTKKTGASFLEILAQMQKEGKTEAVKRLWNLKYSTKNK